MEWYERDEERYLLEVTLLKRHHRGTRILIHNGLFLVFKKILGRRAEYLLKIVYPSNFPYSSPIAYPVKPRIIRAPHQYQDGRLCLYSASQVGPKISGKVVCDWCVRWIRSYEMWLDSGRTHFPAMSR